MLQTLYSKLVSSHLLVVVVALSLVGVLSTQLFKHYYISQAKSRLTEVAEQTADSLARVIDDNDASEKMALITRSTSTTIGARICVFDSTEGGLLATSDLKRLDLANDLSTLPCDDEICTSIDRTQTRCYPGAVISVAAPIRSIDTDQQLGVLLLRRPLHEIHSILHTATYLFIGSGVVAAAMALILAAFVSKTISRPLSEMAQTASDLADGDFSARVKRSGPLELRTLAASLNYMARELAGAFAQLSGERERLANVLAGMAEGVIGIDGNGKLTTINQAADKLLDIHPEQLIHRQFQDLPLEDNVTDGLRQLLDAHTDAFSQMIERSHRQLRLNATRIEGGSGGLVLVITDVTQAERLARLRREFVANASHELRAPLTSIQGFMGALADGTAETEQEKNHCLQVAGEQIHRMRRLVDQLLELSRLQAGEFKLQRESLDLEDLLNAAVRALQPQANEGHVQLTLDIEDNMPTIHADGDNIMQVATNLIENAIRYSPSECEVLISAFLEPDPSHSAEPDHRSGPACITVSVRDYGPGIPEHELSCIWERFHRVDKSRQRSEGGTGLGLAIAKEIVTAHGGSVYAENAGGGARFTFNIPID